MVGDQVTGFRHHPGCHCRCGQVAGKTGTVIEEHQALRVRIVEFEGYRGERVLVQQWPREERP